MEKAIICVPLYKYEFEWHETISLTQLLKVMCGWHITFVIPKSYRENDIKSKFGLYNCSFERFDDEYFESTKTYSALLLKKDFYERFVNKCEYILIYQLDAFVFRDDLKRYCDMGFDYIGAPVRGGIWSEMFEDCGAVGNGGFSLRKVSACIEVVSKKNDIIKNVKYNEELIDNEDLFFSYCGKEDSVSFKTPNLLLASGFSQQDNYDSLFSNKVNEIFGCHAWQWANYEFWYKRISEFGYTLPRPELNFDSLDLNRDYRIKKAKQYLKKKEIDKEKLNNYLGDFNVVIWGAGVYGKKIYDLLIYNSIVPKYVVDKSEITWASKLANYKIYDRKLLYNMSEDDVVFLTMINDNEALNEINMIKSEKSINYLRLDQIIYLIE